MSKAKRALVIIGAVITAAWLGGVIYPAVSNATPQEDAVVQQTADAGYHYTNIPAVIINAHKVCNQLGEGQPEFAIVGRITEATGDPVEAQTFFNIATANLCP